MKVVAGLILAIHDVLRLVLVSTFWRREVTSSFSSASQSTIKNSHVHVCILE